MKSVLWRVAQRLSYIEDARCLKVNSSMTYQLTSSKDIFFFIFHTPNLKQNTVYVNIYVEYYI